MYFASEARAIIHHRPVNTETRLVIEELDDLLECIQEQDVRTELLVENILAAIELSADLASSSARPE